MANNKRGVALVMACLLVTLVTAYGSAMMVQSLTEQQSAQRFLRLSAAFQAAEAGLDRALTEFKTNANWAGAAYTTTLKGGYDATVTNLSATLRKVVVTGHYPSNTTTAYGYQSRQVEGTVSVQEALFNYAVFAATTVEMDSNARADSYDSGLGAYGGSNVGTNGDVGSNSTGTATITLGSNAYLGGDAVIGPGGNVTTDISQHANATITGSKQTLVSTKDMTSKTYPGGSTTNNLVLTSNQQTQLSAGTYTYNYIDMGSNSTVEVTGNATIYVNQYFKMDSNTQFVTASSCPTCTITIYVNGDTYQDAPPAVEFDSNSLVSAGKPTQLALYVTGTSASAREVELDSNVTFTGALHAPLSPVELDSNVTVYGAVMGQSINLDSNATIHYDEALAGGGGGGGTVQLLSWREL
ncbi:MAG: pilus assembly PilX N-terminal domain-containing protein [Candidatus Omnitrophica bacterium]|nr:pilus assembly PilX N-terminal domain-containing protein [Candidatus Omnitrophota bacterium]